ncbi:hypothetical protein C8Q80DRAFT_559935 [Daedaleopsis nitida]|nr:hypothetical protein C8Q80DRAFT_559935 [Daedaleopsis nitida]
MTKGSLILLLGAVVQFAAQWPYTAAQNTTAVCSAGYDWMNNSLGQSPCLTAAWLLTPCDTAAGSTVPPLPKNGSYPTPRRDNSDLSATPCRCNSVIYSLLAACATCQGGGGQIPPWPRYITNCTDSTVEDYPINIPGGTAVPVWAFQDVSASNTWDLTTAQEVAAKGKSDKTADNYSPPGGKDGTQSRIIILAVGGIVGGLAGATVIAVSVYCCWRSKQKRKPRPLIDFGEGNKHVEEPVAHVVTPFSVGPRPQVSTEGLLQYTRCPRLNLALHNSDNPTQATRRALNTVTINPYA